MTEPDPALDRLRHLVELASHTQNTVTELLEDQGYDPEVIAREADRASRLALLWGADASCGHSEAADALDVSPRTVERTKRLLPWAWHRHGRKGDRAA
jgi:hypothetical protein